MSDFQYFRGESKDYVNTSCLPTIFRHRFQRIEEERNYYITCYSELEKCKTFKIGNEEYINIKKLTLLQHYGIKTRLLDLTKSKDIAMYFACSQDFGNDGYIYRFIADGGDVVKNIATKRIERKMDCLYGKYELGVKEVLESSKPSTIFKSTIIDYADVLKTDAENVRYTNQNGSMMLFGFKIVDNRIIYDYEKPQFDKKYVIKCDDKYNNLMQLCFKKNGICSVFIYPDSDLSIELVQQFSLLNCINDEYVCIVKDRIKKFHELEPISEDILKAFIDYKDYIISNKNLFYFLMVETLNYMSSLIKTKTIVYVEKIIKDTINYCKYGK